MRFLCLHGIGSNSQASNTFEQQTAAIRYELGTQHTYDFVEGALPWESCKADLLPHIVEGVLTIEYVAIKNVTNMDEATFTFCDPEQPQSCRQAARDIEGYIKEEGPFDGIIGFSLGATMALSWLVNWYQANGSDVAPFKVAVFFSNARQPYDHDALAMDRIAYLNSSQIGKVIDMPTAHIWGSADPQAEEAQRAVDFSMSEKQTPEGVSETTSEDPIEWDGALHGFPLYLGALGLGLALFLTGIEATIVSTSLVTITNDLDDFGRSSWVITSYLLTYTGFLMIWSKIGDIWRVKTTLLVSLFMFTAFSGGCGGAQSLSQLIICRAFQGYDTISSVAGGILSLGLVLGPLIGGAVAEKGSWRWVFLCNVPAGAFSWILLLIVLPANFPNAPSTQTASSQYKGAGMKIKTFFRRADTLGALALLTASSFTIAALQEGNFDYAWSSGLVISFLVISGIFWIAFLLWEWFISKKDLDIYAMFPWRLAGNRIFLGAALGFFTTGLPMTIPFCYVALGGIVLQVVGLFLFSETAFSTEISAAQYGYLVLAGLGTGTSVAVFYMMVPLVVDGKDQSIALSTGLQLRMLGGVLGVAASTTILHNYLRSRLSATLDPDQVNLLLSSSDAIGTFSPYIQLQIRQAYSVAYSAQVKLAGGFSVAQLLSVAMIWKRSNVRYLKR
ncbi:efflux pump antibiotic resistance protein [Aspergillus arachidicola]|uniref:Efflux pump antibiotic resistance protein n=1 Tax=Aspergillus arachidicola TaxID=656916 RepID=A0A2G7EM93_9EURO|nr:efflux pump antibiotic resistance protein [Aspergillus arachidicola]